MCFYLFWEIRLPKNQWQQYMLLGSDNQNWHLLILYGGGILKYKNIN